MDENPERHLARPRLAVLERMEHGMKEHDLSVASFARPVDASRWDAIERQTRKTDWCRAGR